jgi:antitoxin VapB
MFTKTFQNGHSLAVRIPAKLTSWHPGLELEIECVGDEVRIRPAQASLSGVLNLFAKFSPDFMAEGRGEHAQQERNAL